MNSDKASVSEKLETFDRRFEEILKLLAWNLPLNIELKRRVQLLLRSLKADLGSEYKKMDTVRGEVALNKIEKAYYKPSVQKAFVDISVKWNSVPNRKWFSELYSARISITYTLDQLRRNND